MARIRTVKPEMWQDEKLSPLTPIVRLVFLGLISMADDDGRMVDNTKSIDGFLFPATEDSSRAALDTLARLGRILRYTSESGQRLIQITNWSKHQKVDKHSKYTLPAPTAQDIAAQGVTHDDGCDSRTPREGVEESSRSDLRPSTPDLLPPTPIHDAPDGARACDSFDEEFAALWAIYPKREGGNSRHDALKAYRARRRTGVDHQAMLDGVRRYTAYCESKGWIRTTYVKQASAFLGPALHFNESWDITGVTAPRAGTSYRNQTPEEKKQQLDAALAGAADQLAARVNAGKLKLEDFT